jgi:hypothetical protein
MILPSKHIRADRSLIAIGGDILGTLAEPRTVSEVWEATRAVNAKREDAVPLTYDWFVLALTFLYAIAAVRKEGELLLVERSS